MQPQRQPDQFILQPQPTDNPHVRETPAGIKDMEVPYCNICNDSFTFWGLSVYCGCKMNRAAAFQVN